MTKILDCTIRDGGHLTKWHFSKECIRDSYITAKNSNIDYFEIGYRNTPKDGNGEYYTCNDNFLFSILGDVKENCKLSIMIDTGKSTIDDFSECKKENTLIDLVRVASYPENLDEAFILCEKLKEKNYEVFLNLMAISRYKDKNYLKLYNWQNKESIDAIYFADSFGALFPNNIIEIQKKLNEVGFNKICFHSHNNMQLAFSNSISAIERGFYSIDASVNGMGRGSGNLPIEILLSYLNQKQKEKYNPIKYFKLIEDYYSDIKKEVFWGYELKSLISGINNIHPNYLRNIDYKTEELWNIARIINKEAKISFDESFLERILLK